MLLKALWRLQPAGGERRFSTLYRVDAIEGGRLFRPAARRRRFSTLYRVDAIEGFERWPALPWHGAFQYPLSGRCY